VPAGARRCAAGVGRQQAAQALGLDQRGGQEVVAARLAPGRAVGILRDFLPFSPYPVRVGTHFNTAFGLRMAADYADGTGAQALGLDQRGGQEVVAARLAPGRAVGILAVPAQSTASCRASPSAGPRPCFGRPPSPTAATARSPISPM
jgi:hypothetical protein